MNKILVNVYVPALADAYDMFIPPQLPLFAVTELIKKAVEELSDGRFFSTRETVLSLRASGEIPDMNKTFFELEIGNGSKLLLI